MIPYDTVQKIKEAAQIAEVIGDFVSLKKKGADYKACCPFHNEKTPSFSVSVSKGLYKCFGCGKSGNAVTFLMDHENMTYLEALKYLANKYHIEVVEKEETAEEMQALRLLTRLNLLRSLLLLYYLNMILVSPILEGFKICHILVVH